MAVQPECEIMALNVNGADVEIENAHQVSLLDALRDQIGLISPKDGCQPMGQCGCCTVLVDGKPRLSCTTKASMAAGKNVITLEGLSEETRKQIADCFVHAGGVQCGFCIPGFAMRAHALLERNPEPTRQDIAADMRAHLCRCTGYTKIIDSVEVLGKTRRGEGVCPDSAASENGIGKIGTSLPRYTGHDAVLGDRLFIDDIKVPGMAYGAMRFSDHPRALVRRIDTSAAESLDGVIRVVTARDVPGDRFVGLIVNDWPTFVAEGEETRYVGDVLAAVVAEDEATARKAAELIDVDYEVREPVADPRDALKPDAPKLHPKGNLLSRSALSRGDVEKAFAESTHVVEGEWRTQMIEHMYLEPEACIAIPLKRQNVKTAKSQNGGTAKSQNGEKSKSQNGETSKSQKVKTADRQNWESVVAEGAYENAQDWDDGDVGLYLLTQGQGVFDDRRQCCSVLGWEHDRMKVELVSNGGAFGGKEDMSIQAQTCLLAYLARMPVKTVLTRFESMRLHPKRHPITIQCKVGCDAEGRITGLKTRSLGDTGAYASVGAKVLERAGGHSAGPYRVPVVDIEALAVYTNNTPCGAMRGFGANQAALAIESCLDMLSEKVGIDGWEIRSRNILEPGDMFCSGQRLTKPFGLRKTLEAVKDAYRNAKYAGIACGIKNVGVGNGLPEAGRASMTVEDSGRIMIRTGFTEMGQGLFTVLIQTAVEETGLSADIFDAMTDTRDPLNCGQTTASRGTVLGCHGVREAAKKLKADLDAGQRLGDLAGKVYHGEWLCYKTDKFGADVEDPKTHLTYGFATQVVILDDEGCLKKVIAAHDVGKVMNPTLLEGQMEGSIHMGLGYALTEDFILEGGHLVTKDVKGCGVLRAHHMPEIECIFIEAEDPDCPYGARGVGEIGLVPTAPAVAGALYKFDGVRRTALPMKDSPAAQAIIKPRRPGKKTT
ncbi:MAG: molybdopterin-dependent oxidoreductase [Phycisphaerales bacterium]|nr:molybdopterin-dependent oxidoreductase [Phycisphaerales bacterium]